MPHTTTNFHEAFDQAQQLDERTGTEAHSNAVLDDLLKAHAAWDGRRAARTSILAKSLGTDAKIRLAPGRGSRALRKAAGVVDDLLAKSRPAAEPALSIEVTAADLLAKSEAAWLAGAITGTEFTTVDVGLRHGSPIEPALLERIAAADAGAPA